MAFCLQKSSSTIDFWKIPIYSANLWLEEEGNMVAHECSLIQFHSQRVAITQPINLSGLPVLHPAYVAVSLRRLGLNTWAGIAFMATCQFLQLQSLLTENSKGSEILVILFEAMRKRNLEATFHLQTYTVIFQCMWYIWPLLSCRWWVRIGSM